MYFMYYIIFFIYIFIIYFNIPGRARQLDTQRTVQIGLYCRMVRK